ncbi:TetR/AcrR family transcriptional regulator [Treponema sp.]|uniref:TetR/AcrR family transcriptional regulator n=1 Tax=Treponema sp. TaxID=166 RepID=UPI00298E290F|nr:TetR/AcrR family transcriptional regulator [Treponema sp.]MCR5612200.1 TetR/AcrR family transcriptional regulator [Treponema sp.]
MAIVVEHDKRKHEILEKALEVFIEEGYEDVTFQKIADRCGITRTTLYIYFKNKREIFLWSIKQLTSGIEVELLSLLEDKNLSAEKCLRSMLSIIVDACEENKALFNVLLSYLLTLQKTGGDPGQRVRRRLVRLQHLLSTVIIRGIKAGEFKKVNVKAANEMIYGLIQSAIFRLSVLDEKTIEDIRDTLNMAVDGLLA